MRSRSREMPVDRSRVCPGPHPTPEQLEALGAFTCPWCHNTGVLPREEPTIEQLALRVERIPAGDPRRERATFIPGRDQ